MLSDNKVTPEMRDEDLKALQGPPNFVQRYAVFTSTTGQGKNPHDYLANGCPYIVETDNIVLRFRYKMNRQQGTLDADMKTLKTYRQLCRQYIK
ncbi:unnamed protein product [Prunus armeniaca]|uniref:Uncharacterized protein n=1 Tax=Prunus armeniaca TaxID=36596 RepID=A0A6J5UFQ8_PRUAR|nr:unnamed protein product [Prunus armeniaca]CAB4305396.1 unnamed protein product [Prunus armeniaca]